jgi:hypothetical protein
LQDRIASRGIVVEHSNGQSTSAKAASHPAGREAALRVRIVRAQAFWLCVRRSSIDIRSERYLLRRAFHVDGDG